MDTRTDEFLNLYRQLEAVTAAEYGLRDSDSAIRYLEKQPEFQSVRPELDYCREVRNLLSHNPKINGTYAVEPGEKMIDLLKSILQKVQHPVRASDIAVPRQKLLCKTMKDSVRTTMTQMYRYFYGHIPVLEQEAVTGVFTKNALLSYLINAHVDRIAEDLTFADLSEYILLEKHREERFKFVPQHFPASQIAEMFEKAKKKQERLNTVFVTKTGRSDEPLLGMITTWELTKI